MSEAPTEQIYRLGYGRSQVFECSIDPFCVVHQHHGPPAISDTRAAIRAALQSPLDFPALSQAVIPDDRVALAVEPDTPALAEIVAEVWTIFEGRGLKPENVTIIQNGASVDPRRLIDKSVREKLPWQVHDPFDESGCAYLASTTGGERISLARDLTEADVTVSIGRLGFDPVLGYRGTNSAFYPGLSNADAVAKARGQGHAELQPEDSRPMRQVVDEIGWLLGNQFSIQSIASADGAAAARIIAGASESVLRHGIKQLTDDWSVELDDRPEVVVAAVDADSGGHGWDQIAAAIATAGRIVRRDGRVIVLSELSEPVGPGLEILQQVEAARDAIKPLRLEAPPDLIAATQIAGTVDRARVCLLSSLDNELVEDLFMFPLTSDEATRLINQAETVALLASAQNVHSRIR